MISLSVLFLLPAFPSNPFYRFFYFFNKIKLSITMTKRLSCIANCTANDFFKRVDAFSRGMVCKLLRSFFGKMNFPRMKTRIKIIQVIRVFHSPHCVASNWAQLINALTRYLLHCTRVCVIRIIKDVLFCCII
jgi:hypothetical protein